MFLSSLIEPALSGFGLEVVRADRISQPGMITSQVLEHVLRSKVVIVDLSFHNPNVVLRNGPASRDKIAGCSNLQEEGPSPVRREPSADHIPGHDRHLYTDSKARNLSFGDS